MEPASLAPLLLAAKACLYGVTLLAAGLGLHTALNVLEREGRARTLRTAALLASGALIFAAVRLALANVQLGGSIAMIFDGATLAWTWPALAPSSLAIALGAAAMIVAWRLQSAAVGGMAALLLTASFALTGHAQAQESPGLVPWAVAAHVLFASFWVAAPLTLWPHANVSDDTVQARAESFGRLAVIAVPLLFAIGAWLAWSLAGGFAPLIRSLYGQLLLAKLAVATAALALGAYNRSVVARQLRETPASGRRALVATLSFDVLLFAMALLLVGVATTFTGPPTL